MKLLLSSLLGILLGAGGYTFYYARGTSYLSNDPQACVNCHIMREQFDGWRQGSHHATATCNDCHLPHDNPVHALWVKAGNGYRHSKAFTLQDFAEPIRIRPSNSAVLEDNCLRCHAGMIDAITAHGPLGASADPHRGDELQGCVRCHADVGHGPRR